MNENKQIEERHIVLSINQYEKMIELGYLIGSLAKPQMVFGLNGDLGAGKTTLTKGIGQALGIKGVINSPTFTIMKIYDTSSKQLPHLYHLDVYRTKGSQSDFDLEEYFYLEGISVIEWADLITDLLPDDVVLINIKIAGPEARTVDINSLNQQFMKELRDLLKEKRFFHD